MLAKSLGVEERVPPADIGATTVLPLLSFSLHGSSMDASEFLRCRSRHEEGVTKILGLALHLKRTRPRSLVTPHLSRIQT